MEAQLASNFGYYGLHGMMLPEEQRVPEVAAWAKTKGLEALKTFENLLGDGRKYTAGDEFTVAGVHAVVAWPRLSCCEVSPDALLVKPAAAGAPLNSAAETLFERIHCIFRYTSRIAYVSIIMSVAAADTTAGHTLTIGEMIGLLDAAQYPKSAQLLKTLKQRPAYQKIFNPPKSAE